MITEGIYEPISAVEIITDNDYEITLRITFADGETTERGFSVNTEGTLSYLDY